MARPIKYLLALLLFIFTQFSFSQTIELNDNTLSFEEYIGYVKLYHPLMKQAELTLNMGQANLLKARGGFDPKVEVDFDRKKFKNTKYYNELNAVFKIPTWYGVEFKANFEENTGEYLNPNLTVPEGGLYSAGISFSLAQGFLINERMASLKKARFFSDKTQADRNLLVNSVLFNASKAYFDWVKATNEHRIFDTFLLNANARLKAIKRSVELGDKAEIDVIEARIIMRNRLLDLEAAALKRKKTALAASNYLWINDIPIELNDAVIPIAPEVRDLEASLRLKDTGNTSILIDNHPKMLSLNAKINMLTIDRKLKHNKLLPKLDLQYNFISPQFDELNTFNTSNYKAFLNFSLPLFLRKERGDYKLAKLKIKDANFERMSTSLSLRNKIKTISLEIKSFDIQNVLITSLVEDYKALVKAEERKFYLGESSLFLINSREQKLLDAQLKENKLFIKQLTARVKLYNSLGIPESVVAN